MAKLGFKTIDEMVGRTDLLKMKDTQFAKRANLCDLSKIISPVYANSNEKIFDQNAIFDFKLNETKDVSVLLKSFDKALKTGKPHTEKLDVESLDRTLGTILGSKITKRFGDSLENDTFVVECNGGVGQSFGAFIPKGLTLKLEGDANDYLGKGLSGGKISVTRPSNAKFTAEDNVIIGNVALYGATSGEAYIDGIAGERFLVRNSGATAVALGCGDHGLEYMTGGKALILGKTGKNFAAGMSGGVAYVLDTDHTLYLRLNKEFVTMSEVCEKHDVLELKSLISSHIKETSSSYASKILDNFETYLPSFKKIMPNDYAKMLKLISDFEEKGLNRENAVMEAFNFVVKG